LVFCFQEERVVGLDGEGVGGIVRSGEEGGGCCHLRRRQT